MCITYCFDISIMVAWICLSVIRTLPVLFTINNIAVAVNSIPLKLGTKKINDGAVMQVQFLLNQGRWEFVRAVRPTLSLAYFWILIWTLESLDWDSVVGIATHYELDSPGILSQWVRDFPHLSRPALWPTQLPIQWVLGLSRWLSGQGVALTTYPHVASRLKKEWSIPLLPLWAFVAFSRVNFTFTLESLFSDST